MNFDEIQPLLASIPLFAGIDLVAIEAQTHILSSADVTEYRAGETIQSTKNFTEKLSVLLKGNAYVLSDDTEEGVLLRTMTGCPPTLFGAATLYCQDKTFRTVVRANTPCTVWSLDGENAKKLILADVRLAERYIIFLSDRICFLNRKITAFTAGTAEEKLAVYLSGLPADCDGAVILRSSLSALAGSLNMGRASLYRALDALENNGTIRRDGKKIYICKELV